MSRRQNRLSAIVLMAISALAAISSSSRAQDDAQPGATLKVGDKAPELAGGKWVKGSPVDSLQAGKIYVVEFWATWCGPCRQSIPHLTEMAKEFPDVTFVGQDVWERDQSAVEPFIKEMGDKMDYHVRMDDVSGNDPNQGKMAVSWMQAAGQNGIPTAFIIGKDGNIAWIGHPMAMKPVLKHVVAGKFDAKKSAADEAAVQKIGKEIDAAMQHGDTSTALAKLDEMEKLVPERAPQLAMARFQILIQKKDYDAAYKVAGDVAEKSKDDAEIQNALAWMMVDAPGIEKRNLPLAEKLATQAVAAGKESDPQSLDTLARVYFEKGELQKAVETQQKAVEKADDAQLRDQLKPTLEKYQKALAQKPA